MKVQPVKLTFLCMMIGIPALTLTQIARVHHTSLVLSHYFGGRVGNCSLAESFEGEALSRLQTANVEELRATMRVVERDERYSLWRTPYGDFWMPTASGNALVYDLAEQKRNIYGTRMYPGDIVLDAGANVGVFTRKALMAGASKVIAIEPGPENLECLRRNFKQEIADGRVVLYAKGVWDKDDTLKFSVDPVDSAKDTLIRPIEHAQFIQVQVTTVDNLVEELHLPRVDFIKMDIEGAERKAVTGSKITIAKFHPRMALCIYHVQGDETAVPKLVHDAYAGYNVKKTCFCGEDRILPEVALFY